MFNTLILSGGGVKGFTFLGSCKYLDEIGLLDHITTYIGSSVGSLAALFLNVGYTYDELYMILTELDFSQFIKYNVSELFSKLGIDDGIEFIKLIRAIMKQKINVMDITFIELYNKTCKRLVITGSDITNSKSCCFDYLKTPDMSVIDAIRISIGFALFFTPIEYNGNIYVDGAILNPYPIEYSTDLKRTLGLLIYNNIKSENVNKNIGIFMWAIIHAFNYRILDMQYDNYKDNTIFISPDDTDILSSMNFEITKELKDQYISVGYKQTKKYMDTYYKNKRIMYLQQKYFNLFKKSNI
jgi:NTE family protein